jgi:hypothetical protein
MPQREFIMAKKIDLSKSLSFGFEQTFTIPNWWTEPGFNATSDTPLKREKMLDLTHAIVKELKGSFKESKDIWNHMQYETFDAKGNPSFIVTMDPGSIEVKTPPVLFKDIEKMAIPLFKAAEKAGVVPYRNWWYGIQGGTEGGCHVNMGGLSKESNPLKKYPELVVKYSAYIHNRPHLHYPFMSIDVGPEGNAMRMDEKEGFDDVLDAFAEYVDMYNNGEKLSAPQTYKLFQETNLVTNKSSFPSLYKFKAPLYFIEDRAQEALRSAEEFSLVAELRLKILQSLMDQSLPEPLTLFDSSLHKSKLTSYNLWADFQYWANQMNINPIPYQRFFERQFPKLWMGENSPTQFGLKEGRRPRKILDVKKRGETIISKTVDTNYKRFELYYYTENDQLLSFKIEAEGLEEQSPMFKNHGYLGFGNAGIAYYQYFDIKMDPNNPVVKIKLIENQSQKVLETANFNMNDMKWV